MNDHLCHLMLLESIVNETTAFCDCIVSLFVIVLNFLVLCARRFCRMISTKYLQYKIIGIPLHYSWTYFVPTVIQRYELKVKTCIRYLFYHYQGRLAAITKWTWPRAIMSSRCSPILVPSHIHYQITNHLLKQFSTFIIVPFIVKQPEKRAWNWITFLHAPLQPHQLLALPQWTHYCIA